MKKILLSILAGSLGLYAIAQENVGIGLELRVVTSNVRYMTPQDGENTWDLRKERLADALIGLHADVIGTQEALDVQKEYLHSRLKDYKVVGVGREDGKKKGEHSAIFYNRKRFKALDCGNFWLSETPDVPSLGWDAACIRIASWAFLQEKSTGKKFFFVNTHLDHVGVTARREGVRLLCTKAKEIGGDCPMVITGDFNIYKESDDFKAISGMGLIHVYDIAREKVLQPASWHGYDSDMDKHVEKARREQKAQYGIDADVPQIIDYILINRGQCKYYEIMPPKASDGGFLSDHSPVYADIVL